MQPPSPHLTQPMPFLPTCVWVSGERYNITAMKHPTCNHHHPILLGQCLLNQPGFMVEKQLVPYVSVHELILEILAFLQSTPKQIRLMPSTNFCQMCEF
jgi:hypothetical protein